MSKSNQEEQVRELILREIVGEACFKSYRAGVNGQPDDGSYDTPAINKILALVEKAETAARLDEIEFILGPEDGSFRYDYIDMGSEEIEQEYFERIVNAYGGIPETLTIVMADRATKWMS